MDVVQSFKALKEEEKKQLVAGAVNAEPIFRLGVT